MYVSKLSITPMEWCERGEKLMELKPILTGPQFAEVRRELVSLLEGLSEEEWRRPTAAGNWCVKDVALHILGGDVGNLSRRRDASPLEADLSSYEKLVAFINDINASWVLAGQRMSTRVLIDLLEHVGQQMDEYFAGLDPFALSEPVAWAGHELKPVWFDVAREYTERWHHQQQIRDATGRPGLYKRRLFEPVMDTFVRALPWSFRDVDVADQTAVRLVLTEGLQKEWSLVRGAGKWELSEGGDNRADTEVRIAAEDAWKIFTRGIRGAEAKKRAEIRGDQALGEKVLGTVAVIA
jgi:uncharacterized protein (TIGR03083 family)